MALMELLSQVGIELAPLRIPLERRLQTIGALYFTFSFFLSGILSTTFFLYVIYCSDGLLKALLFGYLVWYIWDLQICIRGGRRSKWLRSWRIWTWLRDYFPARLVKTVELDSKQNYIFGYHPHGIAAVGAFLNFGTEATGFSEKFPGIVPHLLTLEGQFYFPLHRELVLNMGINSVSKESLTNILNYKGKGNAAIIVVGGAQEALHAVPSACDTTTRLKLESRLGFVKMALINGAYLVPVFAFGENDLYHQAPISGRSLLRRLQVSFTKCVGFSPPLFRGRGVFQYTYGLLPYRRSLMTVVGAPIPVARKSDPTETDILELHAKYVEALKQLFETHKKKFGGEHLKLEIIE